MINTNFKMPQTPKLKKTQITTLYSSLQLYFFIKFTKLHLLILQH